MITISAQNAALLDIVESTSKARHVPVRALHLQALMHLPRLATDGGMIEETVVVKEVQRVAAFVPPWPEWKVPLSSEPLSTWEVGDLDDNCAQQIFNRFHYIGSHRLYSQHYGMWPNGCDGRPTLAASVSENDVEHLRVLTAQLSILPNQSRVLSRVFAFPAAPHNAISALLSRIGHLQKQEGIELLLTYVNPNLGFTGVSYRASNWKLVGSEAVQAYDYLDERYITSRELDRRFGFHDPSHLLQILGDRYSRSRMPLDPLLIFARHL